MDQYAGFAAIYDQSSAPMTEDVGFYVDLARDVTGAGDGPIVELAVGTGRVAIPVAAAAGRRVIGVDGSPAMLAVGWFDRRPFDDASSEFVWVARKSA